MSTTEILEPGNYYHIYNRGINGCNLFIDNNNFEYFIKLFEKYLLPVTDIYAWVLMKNHFHFLVRIHEGKEFRVQDGSKSNKPPHQHFSNLFNAYTKAFNKRHERTGSLFEKNFHRKQIKDIRYLQNVVMYIHQNPVHHSFCEYASDYPWSSYNTIVSMNNTKLKRDIVVGWFDDIGNFIDSHDLRRETIEIEKYLDLI